jgi:hypothetical protein
MVIPLQITANMNQLVSDMTVFEFLAAMSLARLGPSSSSQVAKEVAQWTDHTVRAADIFPSLKSLISRGWVCSADSRYALEPSGLDAVAAFYAISLRVLDRGQQLLDVSIYMSLMKKAEELSR